MYLLRLYEYNCINYNLNANLDDGSCVIYGCTVSFFPNFNPSLQMMISCDFDSLDVYGCTDSDYVEYNSSATIDNGSCLTFPTYGCTDTNACNYDYGTQVDDGSCSYPEENFDCNSNCLVTIDCNGVCGGDSIEDDCGVCDGDNSSCIGCTDPSAANYNLNFTIDDGSCLYAGCTDPTLVILL